jgi:hypothetical protein
MPLHRLYWCQQALRPTARCAHAVLDHSTFTSDWRAVGCCTLSELIAQLCFTVAVYGPQLLPAECQLPLINMAMFMPCRYDQDVRVIAKRGQPTGVYDIDCAETVKYKHRPADIVTYGVAEGKRSAPQLVTAQCRWVVLRWP